MSTTLALNRLAIYTNPIPSPSARDQKPWPATTHLILTKNITSSKFNMASVKSIPKFLYPSGVKPIRYNLFHISITCFPSAFNRFPSQKTEISWVSRTLCAHLSVTAFAMLLWQFKCYMHPASIQNWTALVASNAQENTYVSSQHWLINIAY